MMNVIKSCPDSGVLALRARMQAQFVGARLPLVVPPSEANVFALRDRLMCACSGIVNANEG